MGNVLKLPTPARKHSGVVRFDRAELNRLFNVYSRQVASGAWRDYAIDHRPGLAMFSIYRASHEAALFAVVKYAAGSQKRGDYLALQGRQPLKQTGSLEDALKAIEKRAAKVISLFNKK